MAGLSKITIKVGQGGIGRRTPNQDKVSGILFYNSTPPSGWAANETKLVYSLQEAEALGLIETLSGSEVEHYHVSEYFRANPVGELYIGYFDVPAGTYDYSELTTMINAANGRIRNAAIFSPLVAFVGTEPTAIQAIVDISKNKAPLSVLYAGDYSAINDLTSLTDLRILQAEKVSAVLSQDGGGKGKALFQSTSKSVTSIGNALGVISSANVNESIGHVSRFNVSNGTELEVPAYANGDLVSASNETSQGALKDKGYLVIRKYLPEVGGSFYERCPTSVNAASDFAWLEFNRTIDKAIRISRAALAPELQRGVTVNADGTLTEDSVAYFEDLVFDALRVNMLALGEFSNHTVDVDPNQDIQATSTIEVTIKIQPTPIAEFIIVKIGLVAEL